MTMNEALTRRVFVCAYAVSRSGTSVLTTTGSRPYPMTPDVLDQYAIHSPRLGFTCFTEAGQDIRIGDRIVVTGAVSMTVQVVGRGTWVDPLELHVEQVQ